MSPTHAKINCLIIRNIDNEYLTSSISTCK